MLAVYIFFILVLFLNSSSRDSEDGDEHDDSEIDDKKPGTNGPPSEDEEEDDDSAEEEDEEEETPAANAGSKTANKKKIKGKGGSSCHQCKSRRNEVALTYCTSNLDKKNKKCRKKFCGHCLKKFYKETPQQIADKTNWKCPSCKHYNIICTP